MGTGNAAFRVKCAQARKHQELGEMERAFDLYAQAWEMLSVEDRTEAGLELANEALDHCERFLDKTGPEAQRAAQWLLEAGGPNDSRANRVLGWIGSKASRDLDERGLRDDAIARAKEAEAHLANSTLGDPKDGDAWGTLGGLRRRLA